jgi:hypothetical protein
MQQRRRRHRTLSSRRAARSDRRVRAPAASAAQHAHRAALLSAIAGARSACTPVALILLRHGPAEAGPAEDREAMTHVVRAGFSRLEYKITRRKAR